MIRLAGAGDHAAVRRLWERCFADEGGFDDYFFTHLYHQDCTLLWEQDGELCAMVQMLPRTLLLEGENRPVTYIYGACTDPVHRRKGLMAQLLAHSFTLDEKNRRAASCLIPQEQWLFDFYRPFGYKPAFYMEKGTFVRQGTGSVPRRLTKEDVPALDICYRCATAARCVVVRSQTEWEQQLELFDALGKGAYGWFDGEALTAYAFCWADSVQEAIGISHRQAQGLLTALHLETVPWTGIGDAQPLGCIKLYQDPNKAISGYMNLMLN